MVDVAKMAFQALQEFEVTLVKLVRKVREEVVQVLWEEMVHQDCQVCLATMEILVLMGAQPHVVSKE